MQCPESRETAERPAAEQDQDDIKFNTFTPQWDALNISV